MIFGIGLARTGTKSISRAMQMLGYKSKHGIKQLEGIQQYEFVNDIFVGGRWEFLDYAFPGSKFIMTMRDIDSWLKSFRTRKLKRYSSLERKHMRFLVLGAYGYDEPRLRIGYYEYCAKVYRHFLHVPNQLLVMNVVNGDGWEKLCPFLGKDIPDLAFPCLVGGLSKPIAGEIVDTEN